MSKYEKVENDFGTMIKQDNSDGSTSWIPADLANSDYQHYLRWLENPEAEHFTPMVTDETKTI
jgi:hypothetical protein